MLYFILCNKASVVHLTIHLSVQFLNVMSFYIIIAMKTRICISLTCYISTYFYDL